MENNLDRYPAKGRILTRATLQRWFPWIQIIWLLALSPFWLLNSVTIGWLLGIPLIWLASWLIRGFPVSRSPLNIPIGLIAGLTCLSLLITPDLTLSLPKAAGLLLGLAFFYAVLDLGDSPARIKFLVGALIIVGFGISLVGLVGTQWLDKSSIFTHITAFIPQLIHGLPGAIDGFHPNEVAGTLLWVTPLALILALGLARKRALGLGITIGLAGLWMLAFIVISRSRQF